MIGDYHVHTNFSSDCTSQPEELVEKVKALVAELQPFAEIIETKAGCTISSHCGPACLGVLFFTK